MFGVGVIAVAMGLGAMLLFAPDTRIDALESEAARPGTPLAPGGQLLEADGRTPAPRPRVAFVEGPGPIPAAVIVDGDTGEAPLPPPLRDPSEVTFDLDQLYGPDLEGLSAAAMARNDRILACYGEHVDAYGPANGRLTLQLTVSRGEDGGPDLSASMANAVDGSHVFDDCATEAFADAQFEAPRSGSVSMLLPVPKFVGPQHPRPDPGAYTPP